MTAPLAVDRDAVIAAMRRDYGAVVAELRADGWSDEELAEWDASLKSATESGAPERLLAAADHLKALATPIRARSAMQAAV